MRAEAERRQRGVVALFSGRVEDQISVAVRPEPRTFFHLPAELPWPPPGVAQAQHDRASLFEDACQDLLGVSERETMRQFHPFFADESGLCEHRTRTALYRASPVDSDFRVWGQVKFRIHMDHFFDVVFKRAIHHDACSTFLIVMPQKHQRTLKDGIAHLRRCDQEQRFGDRFMITQLGTPNS